MSPDETKTAPMRTVKRFLRREEERARITRRRRIATLVFGAVLAAAQGLVVAGVLPPEGRDLAISAGAVALGVSFAT